nr:MAG TPA: hypothetical protein [Caudoviricetes sp.]
MPAPHRGDTRLASPRNPISTDSSRPTGRLFRSVQRPERRDTPPTI